MKNNRKNIWNNCCPYCNSVNIDYIDNDSDSTKYICRQCDEDFIVHENGRISDRHNRTIIKKN